MAITPVQSVKGDSGGSLVSTQSATFSSGVTQGNLLIAAFAVGNNTMTYTTPSGWSVADQNIPGGNNPTASTAIFYILVDATLAGTTTFSFDLSSAHSTVLQLTEWNATNGWQTNPLDVTAQGDTSASPIQSTTISSGTTATTAQASELWIAALAYKSGSQTESGITSGWTTAIDTGNASSITGTTLYQVASSTGAAHCQYTISTAQYWAGVTATFKPVVATGVALQGSTAGVATATASITGVTFSATSNGVATGTAILTPPPAKAVAPPPNTPIAAKYFVRVRDNTGLAVGPITTYRRLDIVERFNATGDWAIEVDADDPAATLLTAPGYGISITRATYNILTGAVLNSRVEMSGPMTGYIRSMKDNLLTIHGRDDNVWLQRRLAWPTTSYNFSSDVASTSPTLYWRMDASSGTSQSDSSGNSNPGTYASAGTGSYVLNQGGLIDDPNASVLFNGTSLSSTDGASCTLSSPSTTSVTGTFTVFIVASNGYAGGLCGSRGSSDTSFDIQLVGGTTPIHADIGNGSAWITTTANCDSGTALPTTGPYIICYQVTPTGYTIYLDGEIVGSGTYASSTPVLWDSTHTFTVGRIGTNTSTGLSGYGNGGIDEVIVWNSALSDANIRWLSAEAQSRMNHQAYDVITNDCETVLKHYVDVNMGSSAGFSERQLSNFAIETNAHQGSSVTGNARFDPLTNADGTGLLQTLAVAGGNLGFRVTPVNGVLTFQVYQPTDRSTTVYFSQALENLLDFQYTSDSPNPEQGGNTIVVAGGNQQQERIFEIETDANSVGLWGRSEFFQDARDTTDRTIMVQRGQASLAANAQVITFNAVISPSPQTVFGVHFNLGDKVSCVVDGTVFSDIIREVDISLNAGAAEVVTPIVGTPGAITARNTIVAHLRAVTRSVNALRRLQAQY